MTQVAATSKDDEHWYRVGDMPPPFRVHVRLQWAGRMFVGVRLRMNDGAIRWAAVKGVAYLPVENMYRQELDAGPDFWQPLYPDKWQGLLPEPVKSATPKPQFDAAAAAREMEGERDAARSSKSLKSRETQRFPVKQGLPFWWNPDEIRYQTAPNITLRQAEARVMRALTWSRAGAALKSRFPGSSLTIDAVQAAVETAEGAMGADPVPRLWPLPADQEDFDVAMGWFAALNPVELRAGTGSFDDFTQEQTVMLWRALPIQLNFAEIGYELAGLHGIKSRARRKNAAISRQVVEGLYLSAIDKCFRAANGLRVHLDIDVVDQMAALRERNRAARLTASGDGNRWRPMTSAPTDGRWIDGTTAEAGEAEAVKVRWLCRFDQRHGREVCSWHCSKGHGFWQIKRWREVG